MARTGRPRGFDREQAVEQALQLFWEQGYEATSLSELKAVMGGISTASFYAAFESKEALFREAFKRYLHRHGQVMSPLTDIDLSPREAIARALRGSAKMQTDPAHPPGCLLVLSQSIGSPENRHLRAWLAEERETNRARLQACVERAVATGELPRGTDARALAGVFNTFLVGLSTQARDGASLASLKKAISQLMDLWDALKKS